MKVTITFLSLLLFSITVFCQHPKLTLTSVGVENINSGKEEAPLFTSLLNQTVANVDEAIAEGIDIPIPKDMAGGYTHQTHKKNYSLLHQAGNLYQLTGESKYAAFVSEALMAYAKLYPNLPLHPTNKSYATGKLFWQCLNDANWLVYCSQAYDCIHEYLSEEQRQLLESELFIPYADFISQGNPRFFNRIHNHSTWANAAVGMVALAIDNDTLLNKALYGLHYNDGDTTHPAGFLAQLDHAFSPDGYFSEGPYYHRYAIFPFLIFSHALHNARPELDILNYRDGILKKAVSVILQLSNSSGELFPINDAQKGMSIRSKEIVTAVNLIYALYPDSEDMLDWAAAQNKVILNETGYKVAVALNTHNTNAAHRKPIVLTDGKEGKGGGLAILRSERMEVLFKYTTHGMGHGHFDRLSCSLIDHGSEVVQDYGAARWVNVNHKEGGRYLPENKSFAQQTVSHNTVVIDKKSQFQGSRKKADNYHPELYFSDLDTAKDFQVVSAKESHAYPGTHLHRTLYLINDEDLTGPILLDIFQVKSDMIVSADLPIWFMGEVMDMSMDCHQAAASLSPMGNSDGYQHIWMLSSCTSDDDMFSFDWFDGDRFYRLLATNAQEDEILIGRSGANDPEYNLRSEPVLIQSKNNEENSTFIRLLQPMGSYDRDTEAHTINLHEIISIDKIHESKDHIITKFETNEAQWTVMLATNNSSSEQTHSLDAGGEIYKWKPVTDIQKTKL